MLRPLVVALALAGGVELAFAADGPVSGVLVLDGQIVHPARLSADDLKKLPETDLDVTYTTGHGEERGRYAGALLWTVLKQAGLSDANGKHPDLRHSLVATGRDGYMIAFSFGEIDPDFGDKPVIVAYAKDGKALGTEGLRLVVPGDKHGARDVRDLVHIEVK